MVYTGLHQAPEPTVNATIQEDVDAVGLSLLSGAHKYLFLKVVGLLKENRSGGIHIFGGGIIPQEDIPWLQIQGIRAVFTPGTSTEDIIAWVRGNIQPKS